MGMQYHTPGGYRQSTEKQNEIRRLQVMVPGRVASIDTLRCMDDVELVRQFEGLTLPIALWTYRAHVRVAYTYLQRHGFEEALQHMRKGVKKYNAANNVPNSPTSGYHETTTHAFLWLIHVTMQAYSESHPVSKADEFCDMHPQLMSKHILRLFYSPACRMMPEAKTRFVEPDLAALPRLPE